LLDHGVDETADHQGGRRNIKKVVQVPLPKLRAREAYQLAIVRTSREPQDPTLICNTGGGRQGLLQKLQACFSHFPVGVSFQ
jgi:hypothetical protein